MQDCKISVCDRIYTPQNMSDIVYILEYTVRIARREVIFILCSATVQASTVDTLSDVLQYWNCLKISGGEIATPQYLLCRYFRL